MVGSALREGRYEGSRAGDQRLVRRQISGRHTAPPKSIYLTNKMYNITSPVKQRRSWRCPRSFTRKRRAGVPTARWSRVVRTWAYIRSMPPCGIRAGDVVRLENARGSCFAGAVVTDAVRPSVVQRSTGAWYDPLDPANPSGLCVDGNPNAFTRDNGTSKLAQGCAGQHALVQIARWTTSIPPVSPIPRHQQSRLRQTVPPPRSAPPGCLTLAYHQPPGCAVSSRSDWFHRVVPLPTPSRLTGYRSTVPKSR